MLLFRMAVRNALRNVKRSMLTASTVMLGTALLTAALAWMQGVFGGMFEASAVNAGHVRIVQPAYQQREELLPLYENLGELESLVQAAQEVDGVLGAYPRIVSPVTLTKGEEIGDSFALALSVPLDWYADVLDVSSKLVDGRGLEAEQGELVLGRGIATTLDASVGDEVVLLGQTQDGAMSPLKGTVVGIVGGAGITVEQSVFLSLPQGQWLADLEGSSTELLVYGSHRDDALELAARLEARPALAGLAVRPWQHTPLISAVLGIAGLVQGVMSGIIVFICALAVWNTMMMSVLERTAETGVLRAMGLTRRGVITLFAVEGLGISVAGGVTGVVLGGLVGLYLEIVGVELGDKIVRNVSVPVESTLHADMSADVALIALAVSVLTALVGTILPAWHASRSQPSDAMRVGR